MEQDTESRKEIISRFGTAVRRLRQGLGITQEILAERAGLDRTYIGHVERGARNVSLSTIDRLARALDVPTAALLQVEPGTLAASGRPVEIVVIEANAREAARDRDALRDLAIQNSIQIGSAAEAATTFMGSKSRRSQAKGSAPRLVLLDLKIAQAAEFRLLRRLVADGPFGVVVAVLSKSRRGPEIASALRLGARGVLVKPLKLQSLAVLATKLDLGWMLVEQGAVPSST